MFTNEFSLSETSLFTMKCDHLTVHVNIDHTVRFIILIFLLIILTKHQLHVFTVLHVDYKPCKQLLQYK